MGRGYGGAARFERSLRVTGAGAAEMAWEEATEVWKWHGKRLRRGSGVTGAGAAEMAWEEATEGERGLSGAGSYWGWSCRNGMGRGYGGGVRFERSLGVTGARFERSLGVTEAGAAEMAWEEATQKERGLSGRWELLGLELQKWHGKRWRGSEV